MSATATRPPDTVNPGEAWREKASGRLLNVTDTWSTSAGCHMVRALTGSGKVVKATEEEFMSAHQRAVAVQQYGVADAPAIIEQARIHSAKLSDEDVQW